MRVFARLALAVIIGSLAASAARADAPSAIDSWFARATGLNAPGPIAQIAKTDFLCGKTFATMCHVQSQGEPVTMLAFWELLKYDRAHGIGLARSSTDQVGFSIFKAPPPPGVKVSDADLSGYSTGRGLHIGSSYEDAIKLYGPPVKHGDRFVTSYGARDPVLSGGKTYYQPETITLVIDHGRVAAITINVEIFEGP